MSNINKTNNPKDKRFSSRKSTLSDKSPNQKQNRPKRGKENNPTNFIEKTSCLYKKIVKSKSEDFTYCHTKRQYNMKRSKNSRKSMVSLIDLEFLYDDSDDDIIAVKKPRENSEDLETKTQENDLIFKPNTSPPTTSNVNQLELRRDTELTCTTPYKQIKLDNTEDNFTTSPLSASKIKQIELRDTESTLSTPRKQIKFHSPEDDVATMLPSTSNVRLFEFRDTESTYITPQKQQKLQNPDDDVSTSPPYTSEVRLFNPRSPESTYRTPQKQLNLDSEDDLDDLPDIIFSPSSSFVNKTRCKYNSRSPVQESTRENQYFRPYSLGSNTDTIKNTDGDTACSDSSDSNKTIVYRPINSLAFNPIPSTSKDRQTFIKNDELFNNFKEETPTIANIAQNENLPSDDDVQIIENPTETVVVDNLTNVRKRTSKMRKYNQRNEDDDNDCVLIEDKTDNKNSITTDLTHLEYDFDLPSVDTVKTPYNIIDNYIDFDALISENRTVLGKFNQSKTKSHSEVIDVDVTTREQNRTHTNIDTQNVHNVTHINTKNQSSTYSQNSIIDLDDSTREVNVNNTHMTCTHNTRHENSRNESGVQALNEPDNMSSIPPTWSTNRIETLTSRHSDENRRRFSIRNIENVQRCIQDWDQQHNSNDISQTTHSAPMQQTREVIDITVNQPSTSTNDQFGALQTQTFRDQNNTDPNTSSTTEVEDTIESRQRGQLLFTREEAVNLILSWQQQRYMQSQTQTEIVQNNSISNIPDTIENLQNNITHNWEHHNARLLDRQPISDSTIRSDNHSQQAIANGVRNFFESSSSLNTPSPGTNPIPVPFYDLHFTNRVPSRRGRNAGRRRRPAVRKSKRTTTSQQLPQPEETTSVAAESPKTTGSLGECPICMEPLSAKAIASTICGHVFCMTCLETALRSNKKCPTCRKLIKKNGYHQIFL